MKNYRLSKIYPFALFILAFTHPLRANRVLLLPPISVGSVHGGMLLNGTTPMVCRTADMSEALYPNPQVPQSGVNYVVQWIAVLFTNPSSSAQYVKVTLLPGSQITSANSGGLGITPSVTGPSITISTEIDSLFFKVQSSSSAKLYFYAFCNAEKCMLHRNTPTSPPINGELIAGTEFSGGAGCDGTPQVCISQGTTLNLKLTVQEDTGAILANVETGAHRCNGFVDSHVFSSSDFPNGGRPF